MRRLRILIALNVGLLLTALAWWGTLRIAGHGLEYEVDQLRAQAQRTGGLKAERRHRLMERTAIAERRSMEVEEAALRRLRAELAELKQRADARLQESLAPDPQPEVQDRPLSIITRRPADTWKNAGQATPAVALETMLWAAAGGDLDNMAGTIALSPLGREAAAAMLADLPEEIRVECATPEHLVALFAAHDAPLGAMQVLQEPQAENDDAVSLRVLLEDADGSTKESHLIALRHDSAWRFFVPDAVVRNYARRFGTAPPPPSSAD